ncbi:MAG: hypothetical protein AAFV26_09045 [Pseudomonadota bacterium]
METAADPGGHETVFTFRKAAHIAPDDGPDQITNEEADRPADRGQSCGVT